jgi:hypothetical protein
MESSPGLFWVIALSELPESLFMCGERENKKKIYQILNDINKIISRGNGQGKGEILRDSLNV